MVSTLIISYPNVIFKVVFDTTNDENIGNHVFIGISILQIYRRYIGYIGQIFWKKISVSLKLLKTHENIRKIL